MGFVRFHAQNFVQLSLETRDTDILFCLLPPHFLVPPKEMFCLQIQDFKHTQEDKSQIESL